MKVINPSYEILNLASGDIILEFIERIGRECYGSQDLIRKGSAERFVKDNMINKGHESVLEHYSFSVRFIVDRGTSHTLVRHRHMSPTQESTRYCNYSKGKFDGQITVVKPLSYEVGSEVYKRWWKGCLRSEMDYLKLLKLGVAPEEARGILPHDLKTSITLTGNLRTWRHFLKLRHSNEAHPLIRRLCKELLLELKERVPVVFDDIEVIEEC